MPASRPARERLPSCQAGDSPPVPGQLDAERGALAGSGLGVYPAGVRFDDRASDREAKAAAAAVSRAKLLPASADRRSEVEKAPSHDRACLAAVRAPHARAGSDGSKLWLRVVVFVPCVPIVYLLLLPSSLAASPPTRPGNTPDAIAPAHSSRASMTAAILPASDTVNSNKRRISGISKRRQYQKRRNVDAGDGCRWCWCGRSCSPPMLPAVSHVG